MGKQPYTEVPQDSHAEQTGPVLTEEQHEQQHSENTPPESNVRWHTEDGMAKRIVGILVTLVVLYLLFLGYQRYKANSGDNGAIKIDETGAATVSSDSSTGDTETQKPRPATQPRVTSTMPQTPAATMPATDSIAPNPPNGAAFSGSGKFQVYRQGNLTWRVDTETGHSCVLFATMEEWHKPIVYQHGCNNS